MRRVLIYCVLVICSAATAGAQMLRYDQHREIAPPAYATVKLGPFFSNLSFTQTAGFRYTRSEGTGTDFLFGNNRGIIKEDGWEYPFVSTLEAQNYLIITRHMDLDISFSLGYAYYPIGTQEDEFFFDIAEEGASGSLSMQFYITKNVRGKVSDSLVYRTDYIDLRGIVDNYGGSEFEHLENTLTANADWLLDVGQNLGGSIARTDLIVMSDGFSDQEHATMDEQIYYENQLRAFLVVGASASFQQTEYNSDTRASSSMQGYSAYANVRLTERTDGSVAIGYDTGSSDDLNSGSTESVSESMSLSTQLSRNMRHGIWLERGLTGGFNSPFDIHTAAGYQVSYAQDRASISFNTSLSTVEPQVDTFTDYSAWLTALQIELPVTRFVGLICNADYAVRDNGEITTQELSDPEYTSDYDTLSVRAGTSLAITGKVKFHVYYQHIDRMSDNADLEYTRDIFAGTFTFRHSF